MPPVPPVTFQQHIATLPDWEQLLIQDVTTVQLTMPALLEVLTNPAVELLLGSDGGAKATVGSFGAVIASQVSEHGTLDHIILEIGGYAYGLAPSSFRAESYGQLAVLRLQKATANWPYSVYFSKSNNSSRSKSFASSDSSLIIVGVYREQRSSSDRPSLPHGSAFSPTLTLTCKSVTHSNNSVFLQVLNISTATRRRSSNSKGRSSHGRSRLTRAATRLRLPISGVNHIQCLKCHFSQLLQWR